MSATLQKIRRSERRMREAVAEKNRALRERDEAVSEHRRLLDEINSPHTSDFLSAVNFEAVHQRERWGAEHDAGKEPQAWYWLLGYLSGKALAAGIKGDQDKMLHHIVSSAAALLNWHAHATGESTRMRPGINPPKEQK